MGRGSRSLPDASMVPVKARTLAREDGRRRRRRRRRRGVCGLRPIHDATRTEPGASGNNNLVDSASTPADHDITTACLPASRNRAELVIQ